MDAGATVSEELWTGNCYCPETNEVRLTPETSSGKRIFAIFTAIHESMHYRQWNEHSFEMIFHHFGAKMRVPWLVFVFGGVLSLLYGDVVVAMWCLFGAISCAAIKCASILTVEYMAWEKSKKWMLENYELSESDVQEMGQIARDGLRSYRDWITGA